MGCICEAVARRKEDASFSLETLLRFESQVYAVNEASGRSDGCARNLDCILHLLDALDELSILYSIAQANYAASLSAQTPVHGDQATIETALGVIMVPSGTTSHPERTKKPPIRLGECFLDYQEQEMVERLIIDRGLSKLQKTIRLLQTRVDAACSSTQDLGLVGAVPSRKKADFDAKARDTLARLWETKARCVL